MSSVAGFHPTTKHNAAKAVAILRDDEDDLGQQNGASGRHEHEDTAISEAGLTNRVMVETAGLLDKPLSCNFDIATVRAVYQVLSADHCEKAAYNIAAALPSGGEIFIIGFVLDDGGLTPKICVA